MRLLGQTLRLPDQTQGVLPRKVMLPTKAILPTKGASPVLRVISCKVCSISSRLWELGEGKGIAPLVRLRAQGPLGPYLSTGALLMRNIWWYIAFDYKDPISLPP